MKYQSRLILTAFFVFISQLLNLISLHAAEFKFPLFFDLAIKPSSQSVYVANPYHCVVYFVAPFPLGGHYRTVFAGKSGECLLVDGNKANARFVKPAYISYEKNGYIYVVDDGKYIRRINVITGDVDTVSYTLDASLSRLETLHQIAFDNANNMYMINRDGKSATIVRLNLITKVMSLYAGQKRCTTLDFKDRLGTCLGDELVHVQDLTVDSNNHVYLSVAYSSFTEDKPAVIAKIDAVTGQVSVFSGSLTEKGDKDGALLSARYNMLGGLYFKKDKLYVADSINFGPSKYGATIRVIDLKTNIVSTIAGTSGKTGSIDGVGIGGALFSDGLYSLVVDEIGNVFVQDFFNTYVRHIDVMSGVNEVTTLGGLDLP